MIGMGTVSVSNIKNGKDGATGMGIESTYVQYCYGASGTNPPGEYLVDENGNYLVDQNGNYFTNGQWRSEVPKEVPGLFLWSKTVTVYEDGTESVMYSLGKEGTGIISEKRLYYLSSSMDGLQDGFWTEEQPYPIPDGYYLWGRYEFIMSDGSVKYTNPIYEKTLSGVISEVDNANLQIRNQVWKTDITNMIGEWDTTNEVTRRVTDSVTDINGIWTSITNENQKTVTKADGTTVTTIASKLNEVKSTADGNQTTISHDILGTDGNKTSLKSVAEQTADHLSWIIDDGTDAASMTLTSTALSIIVRDINLQGRVSFTDLKSDVGSKVNLATSWTEVNVDPNVTTINGGFIRSHTIVAEHLNTNAIKSFGKYNAQTGKYTGGYARDKNSTYSTTGSFFDMENGNIFTPSFSIINTIPTGETLTAGGYFKGTVTASGGSIGGWTIDGNLLYSAAKTPGSTSMILTPTGVSSSTSIGGSTGSKSWSLTIKDKFGVTTDGYLYATNANISGKITSTEGSIGGININNIGIYTGTKSAANSTQDGFLISNTGAIYLGAYNSTRNSTAFQVNPNGYVKAYNLDALGGNVGGWTITDTMLYYNSATSSNPTRPSTTSIILSPRGNTPSPAVSVGGSGTATKNWGMTIGTGFGVTTSGELWCNQAHVTGTIFATAGQIGDCEIINGHLNVASATIDEIDGSKITAGTITADRINITNLGDLSTALGNITSGSMGWYSGSGSSYTAFGVDSNGKLTATSAVISGTLTAGAGSKIGPWVISATSISKNGSDNAGSNYKTNGTGNMYFGDDGLSISNVFYVDSSGSLTAENATITGTIYADTYKMFFIDRNRIKYATDVIKAESIKGQLSAAITIGAGEDSNIQYPANIQLIYSNTEKIDDITAGTIVISAPTKIQLVSSDVKINTISIGTESSGSRLKINSDLRASTIYSSGTYRAFYDGDNTVPCIQVLTTPSGITSSGWLSTYSVLFGSNSSYNCIAVPINGDDIFFRIKSSANSSNYTWYSLRDDILSGSGGGGGTSYSFNSNEFTVSSNNTVSLKKSYLTSSDLSGYATENWVTNKGYITNSSLSGYAEKTNSNQVILAKQLKATTAIYMENVRHAATTSATWVSAGSTQPSGMSDAYRLYLVGSSSKRYKDHLGLIDIDYASKILDIPVVKFKYKDGYLADDDEFIDVAMPGFYAEDVEAAVPEAVFHQNGKVENWIERHIIPLMLRIIQDQQKRIEELEKKLAQ